MIATTSDHHAFDYLLPEQEIIIDIPLIERNLSSWADFPFVQQSMVPIHLSPPLPASSPSTLDVTELTITMTPRVPNTLEQYGEIRDHTFHKNKKGVRFTTVTIREHAVTIGEHDWCEGPLALTLDWKHAEPVTWDIDGFEWGRHCVGRMPRGQLVKLDYWQRKQLLQNVFGFTEQELIPWERKDQGRCVPSVTSHLPLRLKTASTWA